MLLPTCVLSKCADKLQRMDSTQVGSNIRRVGRVQLLVEVLQRVQRMLNKSDQERYTAGFAPYVQGHAGQYVYHMKAEETDAHLQRIGEFMHQLLVELKPIYATEPVYQVLERVFGEHFRLEQQKRGEHTQPGLERNQPAVSG